MAADQTLTELDAQYRVLKEGAGVLIAEDTAWLRVEGPDAAEYLEGQLTNEIEALEPGGGCYAALLDRKGKMQSDMRVLRTAAEEFLIETEAFARPRVAKHLETYKVASQVEIEALDEQVTVSLIGPASETALGSAPLAEHRSRPCSIAAIEGLALGTARGIDLLVATEDAEAVVAALCERDAERVETAAVEILRVEAGVPRYGREMDETTIPEEAGINERAVSFTKGCYIGQETVARLHYKGKPNRHLRRLALDAPVGDGETVSTDEREVGTIGTAIVSPAHGPIALAILRREAEPGATVKVGDGEVAARVEEAGS